jgi:hypothetical protein
MPMEPTCFQSCRPTGSRRCARCGSDRVRDLGPESPSIEWLACMECRHVWARALAASPPTSVIAESAVAARAPSEDLRSTRTKPPEGAGSSPGVRLGSAFFAVLL